MMKHPRHILRTLILAVAPKDGFYWATFYHSVARYTLPEGAAAYTMDANHHLYRLGTDGRTIRENTAVVIISDKADITLTRVSGDSEITINGGGNILRGSDSAIPAGESAYVLSVDDSGSIGFRRYTGDSIPANKAYYIKTQ